MPRRKATFDGPNGPISVTLELVTPEMAAEYLRKNTSNRKIRRPQVELYKRDLEAGRWMLTHQGAAFAGTPGGIDEILIDAQHRFLGIVETGIAAWMFIFRGMPKETFARIDGGKVRNTADVLGLAGHANTGVLSPLVRLVYNIEHDTDTMGAVSQVTTGELEDYLTAHPTVANYLDRASSLSRATKMVKSAAGAAAYFTERIFTGVPAAVWDQWYEGLETGASLPAGDPRLALRNALDTESKNPSKNNRPTRMMGYYIKALQLWLDGETVNGPLRLGSRESHPAAIRARYLDALYPDRHLADEA